MQEIYLYNFVQDLPTNKKGFSAPWRWAAFFNCLSSMAPLWQWYNMPCSSFYHWPSYMGNSTPPGFFMENSQLYFLRVDKEYQGLRGWTQNFPLSYPTYNSLSRNSPEVIKHRFHQLTRRCLEPLTLCWYRHIFSVVKANFKIGPSNSTSTTSLFLLNSNKNCSPVFMHKWILDKNHSMSIGRFKCS